MHGGKARKATPGVPSPRAARSVFKRRTHTPKKAFFLPSPPPFSLPLVPLALVRACAQPFPCAPWCGSGGAQPKRTLPPCGPWPCVPPPPQHSRREPQHLGIPLTHPPPTTRNDRHYPLYTHPKPNHEGLLLPRCPPGVPAGRPWLHARLPRPQPPGGEDVGHQQQGHRGGQGRQERARWPHPPDPGLPRVCHGGHWRGTCCC